MTLETCSWIYGWMVSLTAARKFRWWFFETNKYRYSQFQGAIFGIDSAGFSVSPVHVQAWRSTIDADIMCLPNKIRFEFILIDWVLLVAGCWAQNMAFRIEFICEFSFRESERIGGNGTKNAHQTNDGIRATTATSTCDDITHIRIQTDDGCMHRSSR